MHSARELVTSVGPLTSLPEVYLLIRDELEAPAGSIPGVARAIAGDPALAARLLQVVNSPFYGYGRQIDSIQRAVTILGLQQVHDLVLLMSIGTAFAGFAPAGLDMVRFWRGSVLCGLVARQMGFGSGLPAAERLFLVGLLSDIGHLVMYQTAPVAAVEAMRAAEAHGERLCDAERRLVGCDFAEVGAALTEQWKLPSCFPVIIGAQLDPRLGGDNAYEAAVVHVASQVVRADREAESSEIAAARVDPVIWSLLDMNPESLGRIRHDAELNLAAYLELFFPALSGR